jgi:hypothetical protein
MSDSVYRGSMTAFGNIATFQQAAEAGEDDGSDGPEIRLEDRDGNAYGHEVGSRVENLEVNHVPSPTRTSGLPNDLQERPFTASQPKPGAARRGRNYISPGRVQK